MKLEKFFTLLKRIPGVTLAQGDFIPSPDKNLPPSLYVNIIYREKFPSETHQDFIDDLRKRAIEVIAEATNHLRAEVFKGLCVSFFHIPAPGSNIRIYRTYALREQMANIAKGTANLDGIEESHHPELRKLLR